MYRLTFAFICSILATQTALSATISDYFEDGSAVDAMPLTWVPGTAPAGDRGVFQGSYRMTAQGPASSHAEEMGTFSNSTVETQLRISEGSGWAGLFGRSQEFDTYIAVIHSDGTLGIAEAAASGEVTTLGIAQTEFRPTTEDVRLRFDMVDATLSVTAWRPTDAMPTPQVVVEDHTFSEGGVGFVIDGGTTGVTVDYRHFEVVPEPSSFVLLLGSLGLIGFSRRRRLAVE